MPARHLILLPPSEGKAPDGDGPPWAPGTMAVGELDPVRRRVARAAGLTRAIGRNPTMAAIERYTGVLYKELDAGSITGTAKRRLNANVLTVSGLWGLVAPRDPIPDYRLKMSASVPPLGRLSTWWPPEITAALVERARGAVVWDLLPNEHAAAIDWTAIAPRLRVTATFLDHNGRTVSHWNKLLKGSIVRWLVESGEQDPLALADFEHPQGYALDVEASTFDLRTAELVLRER